jgi:hypothetical protein
MFRYLYSLLLLSALVGCAPGGPQVVHPAFVAGRGVYVSSISISSMPRVATDPTIRAQFAPKVGVARLGSLMDSGS